MLKLGVNVDHVATLREARYRGRDYGEPDPVSLALVAIDAGAHSITVHLREDRRHIVDRDVFKLRDALRSPLNLEMANSPEIIEIALQVKPAAVCLVPERREEVTTEGGLDVVGGGQTLKDTCSRFRDSGIDVSLFIAPDNRQVEAAASSGVQFIELHTGTYAEMFGSVPQRTEQLGRLIAAARDAHSMGLKVNAGHGLNVENVPPLFDVPHLVELNIGHSIISRALESGLASAVREMLAVMAGYPEQT